jgi:uncharacterized protein YcbK (DUF882 family)
MAHRVPKKGYWPTQRSPLQCNNRNELRRSPFAPPIQHSNLPRRPALRHRTLLAIAALSLASFATAARAQDSAATANPAFLTSLTSTSDAATPQPASPADPASSTAAPLVPAVLAPATPASAIQSITPAGEPPIRAIPDEDNPAAQASDPDFRAALDAAVPVEPAAYATEPYRLRLHNLHTLEDIDIVYRIGDNYQPDAVARLNYFLRDHYTQDVIAYDPREFDLLHDILRRLGRPSATIDIVCGYRTQETNEILRASSQGVAEHSQHILGHAIDIRIPGSTTPRIRNAALSLNEGGVGYYPTSHFVHVDVGAIRTWTYSPRRHRRSHLRRTSAHHRQIAARSHHSSRTTGM